MSQPLPTLNRHRINLSNLVYKRIHHRGTSFDSNTSHCTHRHLSRARSCEVVAWALALTIRYLHSRTQCFSCMKIRAQSYSQGNQWLAYGTHVPQNQISIRKGTCHQLQFGCLLAAVFSYRLVTHRS